MPAVSSAAAIRLRVAFRGAVQGVGFRPFLYRLAAELDLTGWVRNGPAGVTCEVEGADEAVRSFLQRIPHELPPRAAIHGMEPTFLDPAGPGVPRAFVIEKSDTAGAPAATVLPDIATCADCLREIFDPADRRYRYPFTNCTNCGPRYSILESLPYDRARTTLKRFPLCDRCRSEFDDPARSPLPRPADGVSRVWTSPRALDAGGNRVGDARRGAPRRGPGDSRGCDRGGPGGRRLPPDGRCALGPGRAVVARTEGTRGQAVRGHVSLSRPCSRPRDTCAARGIAAGVARSPHCAGAPGGR